MKIGGEPLFSYWGGIGARARSAADASGCVQMRCEGGATPNSGARPQVRGRLLPPVSDLNRPPSALGAISDLQVNVRTSENGR